MSPVRQILVYAFKVEAELAGTPAQTGKDRGKGLNETIGLKSYLQSNPPVE